MSLQQKEITFDQWFTVTQTEDPKMAAKLLAHQKLKHEKKLRKQAIQDMQQQHQNKMQEIAAEKDVEETKGKLEIEKAKIMAQASIQSAQIQSDGRIKVKEIAVESEPQKAANKTESGKELAIAKNNIEKQQPLPA